MRVTYRFPKLKYHALKRGNCVVCGRQCVRQKMFWQTHSPYNLNAEGREKSRDEIYAELRDEAIEWHDEPACHQQCEEALKKAL